MENYSYATSYPESGDSSPRSREIEFENPPPWEELPPNYKVKFMCSYGGKIHPRPHDNQLSYIGGETKILAVERNCKFSGFIGKLSALCDTDVCFKYQLPGEELDALISVTNDDDLEHMMQEYDRMYRASPKPARLRLFLFPVNQSSPSAAAAAAGAPSRSFSSGEATSDRERFVDALNSGPIQSSAAPSTGAQPNNVDLLFGLDKGIPQAAPVAAKLQDPIQEPVISAPAPVDRAMRTDPIQRQIQDLQRMHIGGQEQEVYRRRSDDNLAGGFTGDYYAQKLPEKAHPAAVPVSSAFPPGYWPEKHVASAGVYSATAPGPEQSVYMIPTPTGMYHAPMARPVTGPTGQGYYAVPRMQPEVYRDQPQMYNVVSPMAAPPAPAATAVPPPTLPPQAQPKVAGFSEGYGMVRPVTAAGVGMVEAGYAAMAYDSGTGRQVYYNAPGGMMASPPQYQAVSADMRPGGGLNQEGKGVVKSTQASV